MLKSIGSPEKIARRIYSQATGLVMVIAGLALPVLIALILAGYGVSWTGFGGYAASNGEVIPGKSLWDWMELLIIPIFLAGGVFVLNRAERESEREIAADRQREAALQSYLDQMSALLLEQKLRFSEHEEVRDVARIRTLTVLRGLDGKRKSLLVLFLHEANLIDTERPMISLHRADLSGLDMRFTNLKGIHLRYANLVNARLMFSNLSAADLSDTVLVGAQLTSAKLKGADLRRAMLNNTDLSGADLSAADLNSASLADADLSGAKLDSARLDFAVMHGASFQHADFDSASLKNAVLDGANLKGAKITEEQLACAKSLKGAILPDGSKHNPFQAAKFRAA